MNQGPWKGYFTKTFIGDIYYSPLVKAVNNCKHLLEVSWLKGTNIELAVFWCRIVGKLIDLDIDQIILWYFFIFFIRRIGGVSILGNALSNKKLLWKYFDWLGKNHVQKGWRKYLGQHPFKLIMCWSKTCFSLFFFKRQNFYIFSYFNLYVYVLRIFSLPKWCLKIEEQLMKFKCM